MNHVNIHEDIVSELVTGCSWGKLGYKPEIEKLDEAKQSKSTEPTKEVIEEAHVCPLCESELTEDISDDQLSEHIQMVLGMTQHIFESLEEGEGLDPIDEQDDEDEAIASEG